MAYQPEICILWDDSQIWGLLAARAVQAMAAPHRLLRASEIASGILERDRPSLLLVPGGSARHKAVSLGRQGIAAIREYVRGGGRYLGFCGGAGLALTWDGPVEGLGLCPWQRGRFDDRLQHFMSGHLHMALASSKELAPLVPQAMPESPLLPVWWPGRFAAERHSDVIILASYERPAGDFWLADLPIADLPPDTFGVWRDLYGLSFTPSFLAGQPCVVYGRHGQGEYVLSYSHMETPQSPHANRWLAHLFETLGGVHPAQALVPEWPSHGRSERWEDPVLTAMNENLDAVLETGVKHGLLFRRTDWLLGWRTGIPGANLNNLWSALGAALEHEPGPLARAFWAKHRESFGQAMELFCQGCSQYLLAERLALTLAKVSPDAVPPGLLKVQREALFGPPMHADGLYRDIMGPLDELAFLQISGQ
jgi:Uncharacterized conserved protein